MKFGLIGHPIAHSLSPALFKAGYNGRYPYELIETADFEEAYQRFLDDYDGINVTAPFKEPAYAKADIISDECRLIGATNLLIKTIPIIIQQKTIKPKRIKYKTVDNFVLFFLKYISQNSAATPTKNVAILIGIAISIGQIRAKPESRIPAPITIAMYFIIFETRTDTIVSFQKMPGKNIFRANILSLLF